MAVDEPIIEVCDLVKRFGDQTVLDGVNLDVSPEETMVVMGGSGSGKSTILRHMIGSLVPNEGYVKLFGQDLSVLDEEGLNTVRKKFGILFQSGALFNSMTIAENVALPLQEHTTLASNIIEIQVKIKLELVGLREHAEKYPAQISGGMKKRAGLARAVVMEPQYILYDEPTTGLDPITGDAINDLIIKLQNTLGVTSIVVTHDMASAFKIADRIAMLSRGRIVFTGTVDEVKSTDHPMVRQFIEGNAQGPLGAF